MLHLGERYQGSTSLRFSYSCDFFLVDSELIQVQVFFRHGARAPFYDSTDALDIWKADLKADLANAPSIELLDIKSRTPIQCNVLRDSSNNNGKLRK
jgi:hypothetical protein